MRASIQETDSFQFMVQNPSRERSSNRTWPVFSLIDFQIKNLEVSKLRNVELCAKPFKVIQNDSNSTVLLTVTCGRLYVGLYAKTYALSPIDIVISTQSHCEGRTIKVSGTGCKILKPPLKRDDPLTTRVLYLGGNCALIDLGMLYLIKSRKEL